MTDQEYKLEIIEKNFLRIAEQTGTSVEDAEEQVEGLMKEGVFISCITACMDEWAGVISARIDESDKENHYDENIFP